MAFSLFQLPDEVIVHILTYLHRRDIIVFSSLCTRANELYRHSTRPQYIVELEKSGFQDPSITAGSSSSSKSQIATSTSVREKLSYLRTREKNWRECNVFRNATYIDFPPNTVIGIYDLTGGYFIYAVRQEGAGLHYVDLKKLSSRGSQKDGVDRDLGGVDAWQDFKFKGNIADFGMSLHENDLVAIISYEVIRGDMDIQWQVVKLHLLSFSTQKEHPLAENPVFELVRRQFVTDMRPWPNIEIAGDYVVILLNFLYSAEEEEGVDFIYVFDWRKGKELMVKPVPHEAESYGAVAFLTPSSFLLPNEKRNTVDVFFINEQDAEPVRIISRIHLHPLAPGNLVTAIGCRADPNPMKSTFDHLREGVLGRQPDIAPSESLNQGSSSYGLLADPSKAIIQFKITLEGILDSRHIETMELVTHRCSLIRTVLDGGVNLEAPSGSPREISWEDWGPKYTRMRAAPPSEEEWITTSAGQRQVISSRGLPLTLRDYHPTSLDYAYMYQQMLKENSKQKAATGEQIVKGVGQLGENVLEDNDYWHEAVTADPAEDYDDDVWHSDSTSHTQTTVGNDLQYVEVAEQQDNHELSDTSALTDDELAIRNSPYELYASSGSRSDAYTPIKRTLRIVDHEEIPFYFQSLELPYRFGNLPYVEYRIHEKGSCPGPVDFLNAMIDEERIISVIGYLTRGASAEIALRLEVFSFYP